MLKVAELINKIKFLLLSREKLLHLIKMLKTYTHFFHHRPKKWTLIVHNVFSYNDLSLTLSQNKNVPNGQENKNINYPILLTVSQKKY